MITITLILVAFLLLGAGCGAVVWFVFWHRPSVKSERPPKNTTRERLPFRWSYIIVPVTILLLSVILSAYFYSQLPAEVAYRFKLDGSPDKWLSREMTMVWLVIPQFLLTLLGGAIAWGMTKLSNLFSQIEDLWIKQERVLSFMGNIVALPQLIIGFTMLDIFSYNLYQIHIMPMWLFLLMILGLATVGLGLLVVFAIVKTRKQLISHPGQKNKEE